MRFVSLFAGVGGFDLGLELAGHECIAQVEIDKHCRTVLDKHWPYVPKHDDVRSAIEFADRVGLVGRTDLVCGGFPYKSDSISELNGAPHIIMFRYVRPMLFQHLTAMLVYLHLGYALMACQLQP